MIVKAIPTGWEVIYQRAHGLLAAQLAHHWKWDEAPLYWTHTLLAIAEHDDGLAEAQSPHNLTEAGAPKHFMQLGYTPEQYRNVMEIASSKSRWNALMTSMHLTFLYSNTKEDKELLKFLEEQLEYQRVLLKGLNIQKHQAERMYYFVEWCDALSLLLCMDRVQPDQRKMEISQGPDGTFHQLWQGPTGELRVEPWPFKENKFVVDVEYRNLDQLQFESIKALSEGLQKAPVQVRKWKFAKS
ncbi:hypothetical protein HNQ92_001586 [Rhabdobacter roseus]|uniref:DUF3891 family protein n=1 Tax=Rhabdobacter roseus TaxID=1655419 RepID=A0A840TTY6_9BACT|nr:DUF3891 family protein [Rhabdobacter roseus]MBB5283460.1 hypothetical protein [Rhabdobacter roseus]